MSQTDEQEKGRFLTDTQREYLQGGHEPPSDNAEYQMRSKIRHRTKGAIHDLGIVARNLSQKDRSLLLDLETPHDTDKADELTEMPDGTQLTMPTDDNTEFGLWGWVGFSREMDSILRFYYMASREQTLKEGSDFAKSNITESIKQALEGAEREFLNASPRTHKVEATVDIETTKEIDIEKTKKRYKEGKELRPIELKALVDSDQADIQLSDG